MRPPTRLPVRPAESSADTDLARAPARRRAASAPDNQTAQRLPGPRIHEDEAARALLRGTGRPGAALGQDVFVEPGLSPARRERVVRHELRHAAQVGGRETDPSQPVRVASTPDRFESDAASVAGGVVGGADPQTLRFFGEDEEGGVCRAEPEATSCEAEPSFLESASVQPSFFADAIDVPGLRNDELNAESLQVDDWLAQERNYSDPDQPEYIKLRDRLKAERTARVRRGHLWLTTATRETPTSFYMLQPGAGRTDIIDVYPEVALDVPRVSLPGPVMTLRQFHDHMAALGVPVITEEEYSAIQARQGGGAVPTGAGGSPGPVQFDPDDPFGLYGYTGGAAQLDTRARLLQQAFPYRNLEVRAGDIAEAFALSAPRDRLVGRNYNRTQRGWSGDWLRPLRPLRGAEPVVDLRVLSGSPFVDLSVKGTRPGTGAAASPSLRTRFATYFKGHLDMLDTQSSKFGTFAADAHPGMPLDAVSAGIGLAIPENHLQAFQDTLRDATGRDLTDTGRPATSPNWDLKPYRAIYERTSFDQPVVLPDGQAPLRTGADLYAALASGRVTQADFDVHIRTLGNAAANRVVAIPGYHTGALRWYEGYLASLGTQRGGDIRAAVNVDTVQVIEEMRRRQQATNPDAPFVPTRGWAETNAVALRSARTGGAMRGGFGVATTLAFGENVDVARLAEVGAVETVAGGASNYAESALRARAGLSMASEGVGATAPRALAMRAGARLVPGVADAGVELWSMARDKRDNSAEEVVVRTGRAAVIGGGAAWAGAAVGTAIGGPIGFIVGFGVGAGVGWLANKLAPGGAEYWERRARLEKRVAELERQVEELKRRMEEEKARRERLETPLDSQAASVAGVESLFDLPVSNPLFTSTTEGVVPTVGELENEYIQATLGSSGTPR